MISVETIISFIHKETGSKPSPIADLEKDCGIAGDDFSELIEAYTEKFNVDMSGYKWYFHHDEEGFGGINIGAMIFKPPQRRVQHIPVTPSLLTEFANKGKWGIEYPPHVIPENRIDITINKTIGIAMLTLLIWLLLDKKYHLF